MIADDRRIKSLCLLHESSNPIRVFMKMYFYHYHICIQTAYHNQWVNRTAHLWPMRGQHWLGTGDGLNVLERPRMTTQSPVMIPNDPHLSTGIHLIWRESSINRYRCIKQPLQLNYKYKWRILFVAKFWLTFSFELRSFIVRIWFWWWSNPGAFFLESLLILTFHIDLDDKSRPHNKAG